jgi:hypothetical protein
MLLTLIINARPHAPIMHRIEIGAGDRRAILFNKKMAGEKYFDYLVQTLLAFSDLSDALFCASFVKVLFASGC